MVKKKTAFVCNDCGAEFARWQGQCSECRAWNTVTEFRVPSVKAPPKSAAMPVWLKPQYKPSMRLI